MTKLCRSIIAAIVARNEEQMSKTIWSTYFNDIYDSKLSPREIKMNETFSLNSRMFIHFMSQAHSE